MLYQSSYWYYLRSNLCGNSLENVDLTLYFDSEVMPPIKGNRFLIKANTVYPNQYLCIKPLKDLVILHLKDNTRYILNKDHKYGFFSTTEFKERFKIFSC